MYALPYAFANLGAAPPSPPQPLDLAEFDANFAFLFNPSVVNALKAGCKGDGTDDAAAINAIVATGARVIYFPWTPTGYGVGPTLIKTSAANCAFVGDPCGTMLVSLAARGDLSMITNPTSDPADNAHRDSNIAFINLIVVGDKGSGGGQTAMCIEMNAVNRVRFQNVLLKNADADGAYFGAARTHQTVGCSSVTGDIRTEDCGRQGVTVTCGDSFDLTTYGYRARFAALDGEVNNSSNFIKNSRFFVYAEGCSTSATGVSVGFDGDGGSGGGTVDDVTVTAIIVGALADGISWRRCTNFTIVAKVVSPVGNGIVGANGNTGPSSVSISAEVKSPGGSGLSARGTNDIIDTTRLKVTGATQTACLIQFCAGGTCAGWELTGNSGAGVNIDSSTNMLIVAPNVRNNSSTGFWLSGTCSGIRVIDGAIVANRFFGFLESTPSTGNSLAGTDISGTTGGADITKPAGSSTIIELRPLAGNASWTPGTITNGASASTTVAVTGAAIGQQYIPTAAISMSLLGCSISAAVTASNTVTVTLTNATGSSQNINAGGAVTVQAIVRRVF